MTAIARQAQPHDTLSVFSAMREEPTYVKVCAQLGHGDLIKQVGICDGNLENPPRQCVVVPVTFD